MSERHRKAGKKYLCGRCLFCPEAAVLDAHRVVPGAAGGTYAWGNILVLCANCHRKVHDGDIVVKGRFPTSRGRVAVVAEAGGREAVYLEPNILDACTSSTTNTGTSTSST